MSRLYRKLKEKSRGCRDREIRQKLELILLGLRLGNVSEACARRGYSRKFYYKWLGRLRKSHWNLEALREQSRRPRRSPERISREKENRIRFYQRRQYGARMIQAMMRREGMSVSTTTICHVFNRRRRPTKKKKKNLNPHRKRYELAIPGQRLQLDVKYVPEFVGGARAYNYVAVDECTRWRFAYAYSELNENTTYDFLEKLQDNCPFPIHTIQTDNGFEFTFKLNPMAQAREHLMDTWCKSNGIGHRLIPPGAKELNGKVERSHRIDEQYFYYRAPTDTLENLNSHQTRWLEFYNTKRLHGGLGYQTPNEKLLERIAALKNESQKFENPELEKIRLRFLAETPKKPAEQEKQRQPLLRPRQRLSLAERLELELKKYNSAA